MNKLLLVPLITLAVFQTQGYSGIVFNEFTTAGGLDAVQFQIDPDVLGGYDTIDFSFTASVPGSFNNNGTADTFAIATSEFTVFDGLVAAINSFTPFGLAVDGNSLTGTYASLGNNNISNSSVIYGQIVAAAGQQLSFDYTIQFADDGTGIPNLTQQGIFPAQQIPEPGAFSCIGVVALIGVLQRRRKYLRYVSSLSTS